VPILVHVWGTHGRSCKCAALKTSADVTVFDVALKMMTTPK